MPVDPSKLKLRPEWVLTEEQREVALVRRNVAGVEFWSHATREHGELVVGQDVHIQNPAGVHKGKWRTTGQVVEVCGHESYMVKLDGSGRTSKRRRSFLKPMKTSSVKTALDPLGKAPERPLGSNTTSVSKGVVKPSTRVLRSARLQC